MANPPFNVDEIDADKIKSDPRLPFGLPGVNKEGKVSNGNYVWISYFYSYLNSHGRAGFVMSSQASSAGGGEARVRQKLVESGDVEAMISVRSNFFYTRTVPCELWFLNRDKPDEHRDKVLMIDARSIYRKVTRKIYDFSPEQEQNILAMVWLYRGQTERYLDLVAGYCRRSIDEAAACFSAEDENGRPVQPLPQFASAIGAVADALKPVQRALTEDVSLAEVQKELADAQAAFLADVEGFQKALTAEQAAWQTQKTDNGELKAAVQRLAPLAEASRSLVRQTDLLYKLASRLAEGGGLEGSRNGWGGRNTRALKAADEARQRAAAQLGRCATSGSRQPGSQSASPRRGCGTWRGW